MDADPLQPIPMQPIAPFGTRREPVSNENAVEGKKTIPSMRGTEHHSWFLFLAYRFRGTKSAISDGNIMPMPPPVESQVTPPLNIKGGAACLIDGFELLSIDR